MKFSTVILAVATFATATFAQLDAINKFPKCAQSCLLSSVSSAGCTGIDFKCICNSKPFFAAVLPCIQKGCTDPEEDQARDAAIALCKEHNPKVEDLLPPPHNGGTPTTKPPPTPSNTGKPSPCKPKLRFARKL